MERPRVALDSVGCKLNQAEIELLARRLEQAGYSVVSSPDDADIYVLNTCTVTHVADRKSRHLLRMARRWNPDVKLVAVGCYAERMPGELSRIDGVDLVIGNDRKDELPRILGDIAGEERGGEDDTVAVSPAARRTRAFIKVQDGCRNYCAYCIVPLVRRRDESVLAEQVVAQVRERVAAGFKEAVLTGTEIGTYNDNGTGLEGLVRRVLAETGIVHLRLSSLQPPEITPGLIGLWHNPRLCPHFHLSLQSGSGAVLRRMRRRYAVDGYRRAVALIREIVPGVAITTDIIVGFPGETDSEFRESHEFCREMEFARIHVFPYSPRPGTAAADMPGHVPAAVKKERGQSMLALAEESAKRFREACLGQTVEVLWEQKAGGVWSGLTGNYIKVYLKSASGLANTITPVKPVKLYRDGVSGEVLPQS